MNKSPKLYRFFVSWARNNSAFLRKKSPPKRGFLFCFKKSFLDVRDNHSEQLVQANEQVDLKSQNGEEHGTNTNLRHSPFHDFFEKNEGFWFVAENGCFCDHY